jgi:hypothetical protein
MVTDSDQELYGISPMESSFNDEENNDAREGPSIRISQLIKSLDFDSTDLPSPTHSDFTDVAQPSPLRTFKTEPILEEDSRKRRYKKSHRTWLETGSEEAERGFDLESQVFDSEDDDEELHTTKGQNNLPHPPEDNNDEYYLRRAKEYLDVMTIGLIHTYQELKATKQKHQALAESINQIQNLIRNKKLGKEQFSPSPQSKSSFEWPDVVTNLKEKLEL